MFSVLFVCQRYLYLWCLDHPSNRVEEVKSRYYIDSEYFHPTILSQLVTSVGEINRILNFSSYQNLLGAVANNITIDYYHFRPRKKGQIIPKVFDKFPGTWWFFFTAHLYSTVYTIVIPYFAWNILCTLVSLLSLMYQ